jgi:hypothetical protein
MPPQIRLPEPRDWGTFNVEPFAEYYQRWPEACANVPAQVVETWIYRHWRDFQAWIPLSSQSWEHDLQSLSSDQVMTICHVAAWPETLRYWGDDLFDGRHRRKTWLGRAMLESGTTPAPIIVAQGAGKFRHPRERGRPPLREPYQLIEGHMRLAYLQGMIRRGYPETRSNHDVFVATLPIQQEAR